MQTTKRKRKLKTIADLVNVLNRLKKNPTDTTYMVIYDDGSGEIYLGYYSAESEFIKDFHNIENVSITEKVTVELEGGD